MTDREKIIYSIEHCICRVPGACSCRDCDYNNHEYNECVEKLFQDVLKLLKKQEPILLKNQHKPYGIGTNANSPWISKCPRCDKKIEGKQTRFCKYCGQAVKEQHILKMDGFVKSVMNRMNI